MCLTHIPSHPYHSSHFTGNAEMNTKWQASVQNPFSHNAPVCRITEGWMFVSQTHMRLYNQSSWDACVLLLSKTFCLLDGKHELLLHLLVTSVRRQVQTIKTTATQIDEGDCYMLHKMFPKLSHFSVFTPGTIFDVYYTAMQPKILQKIKTKRQTYTLKKSLLSYNFKYNQLNKSFLLCK